ncbi:MAG TPA: hypothetical protein VGJ70_20105 [Solirubrobacteraceae bacterium]|jgi:hypothetical protein
MIHPWKIATAATALIGVTAVSTGVTTAYFMRPASVGAITPAAADTVPPAPPAPPVTHLIARPAVTPRPAPRVVRTTTAVTPVAADCVSTGDRAWRIAKPGAIGGLLGAGLGAAGGAIAGGGNGAGKGALIGGLAGTVLGGGYGAYKTKQECGAVFGGTVAAPSMPVVYAAR